MKYSRIFPYVLAVAATFGFGGLEAKADVLSERYQIAIQAGILNYVSSDGKIDDDQEISKYKHAIYLLLDSKKAIKEIYNVDVPVPSIGAIGRCLKELKLFDADKQITIEDLQEIYATKLRNGAMPNRHTVSMSSQTNSTAAAGKAPSSGDAKDYNEFLDALVQIAHPELRKYGGKDGKINKPVEAGAVIGAFESNYAQTKGQ